MITLRNNGPFFTSSRGFSGFRPSIPIGKRIKLWVDENNNMPGYVAVDRSNYTVKVDENTNKIDLVCENT